jgi:hypothetical protein
VNLINASERDAAVELTLDGLSRLAFRETKGYRPMMVPKKSSSLSGVEFAT